MYYIGIDLGTSAMKLLLMDTEGKIQNTVTKEYPLEFPQPGWSQQNPEDWRKESSAYGAMISETSRVQLNL